MILMGIGEGGVGRGGVEYGDVDILIPLRRDQVYVKGILIQFFPC